MINAITNVLGWIAKNISLIIEVIEALLKVVGGIVSLTPSRDDDKIVNAIENKFLDIEAVIEDIAEKLGKLGK